MESQPERWEPARDATEAPALPPLWTMLKRGAVNRCPVCGVGKVFAGFLTIAPECTNCHTQLGRLRADDAPPYFVIFIAGHLLVPVIFWVEKAYEPPMWLHMVVWLPLFTVICTLLLRPVKGAVVGWMLKLGFKGDEPDMPALPLTGPATARPVPPPSTPGRGDA
jgi:uncharacterized protein (DUF983 family)